VGNTFTLPPGPARETQINLVRHWVDLSADLGSPCLRVFAGAVPEGVSARTGRQWVADCLSVCAEYAADHGVILALENHGGVVSEPDGLLDVLRRADSEWVGAKLDSGNFDSADPYADLARCAPYAVSTHAKTEIRRNGVSEPTDYGRLTALLRSAGYRGHLNLEYEGAEDAATAVPRAIAEMLAAARR
jgi:sugar phosphate isomerase/epimerase